MNWRHSVMENIYNQNKEKFIKQYGQAKFDKLFMKVSSSKALALLTGETVNRGLAPNPADFLGSANTIPYVMMRFNIGASVMAGLIELKVWNDNTNVYHKIIGEERLSEIAWKMSTKWV